MAPSPKSKNGLCDASNWILNDSAFLIHSQRKQPLCWKSGLLLWGTEIFIHEYQLIE